MGGKSSRELSGKSFNQRRQRDNRQRSEEQRVSPNELVSRQINNFDATYTGSRTSSTQHNISQEDHHVLENFSHNFERDPYSGNDNDWEISQSDEIVRRFCVNSDNNDGLNFDDNFYQERVFRRPIRRHHSFNENRFQLHNDNDIRDYRSIRCNSMIDLGDSGFPFEGQNRGNKFTHYSNLDISNDLLRRRNSSSSSQYSYDGQVKVGSGGTKRSNWGDYAQATSNYDGSKDGWEDNNYVLDSPFKPRVKLRHSDVRQGEGSGFFTEEFNYRNENERCSSGLSFDSSTSNSSIGHDPMGASKVSRDTGDIPVPLDENCGALDILSFPSEWSSFAVDKTGYVNISLSSPEGKSIERFFNRTSKSCLSITGIVRIENPFLHTLYLLKKEEMAVRNGHVDELFLYHGTKKRFVTSICENNLDWRQYSEMHRFGKGVSFSPSATYSSHYSDEKSNSKILILFKVLVSNCVEGSPEMEIPPNSNGISYDTSIKEDTSVIVKYSDNEFYPLYKIIYKKK